MISPRILITILLLVSSLLPATSLAQWNDSLLKPFVIDHRSAGASPADVSFLLDAPAGKDGFVRVQNGHLVKGNGARLRLWGVHLTDWSRGSVMLPSKEDAAMWAQTLARYGVNCVRLHFIDLDAPRGLIAAGGNDSRRFDAQQLDRLDFLVSELKKRGIYIDLNLNVGRSYKAGDGVRDHDRIRWAKGMTLYDPRLIELQKEYAKQILTHVNPYTKLEYRHDPAIAIVEILNENALWVGFNAPTPYYNDMLTSQYNDWLETTLTPAERQRLREITGAPVDSLIPRLRGPEVGSAPRERYDAEMRFITHAESKFYLDMAKYLRDSLGVKVPITGTADHSHTGSSYPMLSSLAKLDIMDGHTYWQHPGSPPPVNTPMVNDPLHSTVVKLSRTAVAGKPYTVSEFNHPFPNDWASEGFPILAAYGSFQDWDAIMIYTFEPKRDADWSPYVGDPFDISLDPVRMTQMAAGALMFLRGDVRPARQTVNRSYTREQLFESRKLDRSLQPYFTPGFPLSTPLRHGSRISAFDGPPTETFAGSDSMPIVSDTRQLSWQVSPENTNGIVTIDTERSQALIGFVRTGGKSTKNLTAHIDNSFASIVLVSLDSNPLSRTARMLLSAGSRVTNAGLQWNPERTRTLNFGGPPSLIEPVTGAIVLRNLEGALAVSAVALDGAGKPLGAPIAAARTAAGWRLPIGSPVTTWYVVSVRRR
jgi:hypothetical protein